MPVLYALLAVLGLFALFLLFLTVCALLVNPKRYYDKDSCFYRFLITDISRVVMKIMRIRLHVTGMEKVPADRKLLFVGNHISNYDPIVTWCAFRKWRIAYISKASNFKIPWFGRFIRRCCFMDIDRENPRNAIVTINRAAGLLKDQEVSIGVYPEGTRSKCGELLPFHNGVFKVAQKAGSDIAVVSVLGTNKIVKNIPFRKTDVYIDVLEVIPADEVRTTKKDQIGLRVETLLKENKRKREHYEQGLCTV